MRTATSAICTTELGTRGRMRQLERWNSDVLALSAPGAAQYLAGSVELASYQPVAVAAAATATTRSRRRRPRRAKAVPAVEVKRRRTATELMTASYKPKAQEEGCRRRPVRIASAKSKAPKSEVSNDKLVRTASLKAKSTTKPNALDAKLDAHRQLQARPASRRANAGLIHTASYVTTARLVRPVSRCLTMMSSTTSAGQRRMR